MEKKLLFLCGLCHVIEMISDISVEIVLLVMCFNFCR